MLAVGFDLMALLSMLLWGRYLAVVELISVGRCVNLLSENWLWHPIWASMKRQRAKERRWEALKK